MGSLTQARDTKKSDTLPTENRPFRCQKITSNISSIIPKLTFHISLSLSLSLSPFRVLIENPLLKLIRNFCFESFSLTFYLLPPSFLVFVVVVFLIMSRVKFSAFQSLLTFWSFSCKTKDWIIISVTRLGDFLNFLSTNLLTKVAQIFW